MGAPTKTQNIMQIDALPFIFFLPVNTPTDSAPDWMSARGMPESCSASAATSSAMRSWGSRYGTALIGILSVAWSQSQILSPDSAPKRRSFTASCHTGGKRPGGRGPRAHFLAARKSVC